ncbi:hypothetical protein P1X14_08185 [Sphingomonas sp. AOB5]|uniref:hypothetical protein n=1 Tax=Sphingomonas sp. AOB5 TaxID=3034017 RepID=UPI0023F6E1DA|nr:hypothetical protein [Sphingomonas sp. AOB5]MDF7775221.1 hypothetical protein [Sphingomonas sp. AOB5]
MSKTRAYLATSFGCAGAIVVMLVAVAIGEYFDSKGIAKSIAIIPLSIIAILVGTNINRIRQYRLVESGASDAVDETLPTALYLRSFEHDAHIASNKNSLSLFETSEQSVSRALGGAFNFVAIGRPGEELPTLGAGRRYLPDEEWQQEVVRLIEAAQLIVVHVGASSGLQWEVAAIIERKMLGKVIFFIPWVDVPDFDVSQFSKNIWQLGVPIPYEGYRCAFLSFDKGRATYFPEYRRFYDYSQGIRHLKSFFAAVTGKVPGYGYLALARVTCTMNPSVLFRAEINRHLAARGIVLPPVGRGLMDYLVYYPLIFLQILMLALFAAVAIWLLATR